MTLRQIQGRTIAEDVTDVGGWLRALQGCPPVTTTHRVACGDHGDEPATWFYVEADAAEGVARTRCLGCGRTQGLLDSERRWTFPPVWQCADCHQSIAEVVVGGHEAAGGVDWVAVAVRCVECGLVAGVADALVPAGMPVAEVFAPTPVATA